MQPTPLFIWHVEQIISTYFACIEHISYANLLSEVITKK